MTSLIILDPGMRQRAGHYYEYNTALANAAIAAGHHVTIYAHKDWPDRESHIVPYFTAGVGQGSAAKRAGHKMLALLPPWLRAALFAPARYLYRALKPPRVTVNVFSREAADIHLPDNALVLSPSASYADILGLLPLCATRHDCAFRFVVRQLPQDPAEQAAFETLKDTVIPPNATIVSDTNDLTVWLQGQGIAARLIPIPMQVPAFVFDDPKANEIFTFALLGPARGEKGIARMPGLIRAFEGDLKADKIRFVIQTTLVGGQAPEPEVERTIAELKSLQKTVPNIVLIDGDLGEEQFYRALCDASCVLIPYDRARYQARSSGLLVQSYLCGRPAIVPSDTWMADQVPDFLQHTIWQYDLVETCKQVRERPGDMTAFTREWRAKHSPTGTLAALY